MNIKPKVALSQDFLLNLARLPAAVQGKVLKWAIRFQTDPTTSGFNYEKSVLLGTRTYGPSASMGTGGGLSLCLPGVTCTFCCTRITTTRP
jgi:hypothetical protein